MVKQNCSKSTKPTRWPQEPAAGYYAPQVMLYWDSQSRT